VIFLATHDPQPKTVGEYTPEKDFATSCGCGISFSPK